MKTQDNKLQNTLEALPNPPGLDVIVESMLNYQTPVTLKNYLDLAHPGQEYEDLSAEEQTSIPRILLDPSETYYEAILAELARNPKLTVDEAREWMDAFA